MIKNILGTDFKYEDDKMYRKLKTKWNCCNDREGNKDGYIKLTIDKLKQIKDILELVLIKKCIYYIE